MPLTPKPEQRRERERGGGQEKSECTSGSQQGTSTKELGHKTGRGSWVEIWSQALEFGSQGKRRTADLPRFVEKKIGFSCFNK
jgi:hypothetical protein